MAGILADTMIRRQAESFIAPTLAPVVQDLHKLGLYQFLFDATGYGYVMAWSISFYPQLILNWQRKSTLGMSIGFQWYNILGFLLYLIYTSFVPEATFQDQLFAAHALVLTACQLMQVPYFATSKLNDFPRMHGQIVGFLLVMLDICLVLNGFGMLSWLAFLYVCGYIKTCISLVKYTPQLYLNFQRKTTAGFAMGMIFLDLTGGILSICQQLVSCAYDNDNSMLRQEWTWDPVIGNKPKFLLGMIAIFYDAAFLYQHFVCYPTRRAMDGIQAESAPTETQPLVDGTPVTAMSESDSRRHD